jgi:hypothetical protein
MVGGEGGRQEGIKIGMQGAHGGVVSLTTTRNQLAAAMSKMDVHRQAELVALVNQLVPRIVGTQDPVK